MSRFNQYDGQLASATTDNSQQAGMQNGSNPFNAWGPTSDRPVVYDTRGGMIQPRGLDNAPVGPAVTMTPDQARQLNAAENQRQYAGRDQQAAGMPPAPPGYDNHSAQSFQPAQPQQIMQPGYQQGQYYAPQQYYSPQTFQPHPNTGTGYDGYYIPASPQPPAYPSQPDAQCQQYCPGTNSWGQHPDYIPGYPRDDEWAASNRATNAWVYRERARQQVQFPDQWNASNLSDAEQNRYSQREELAMQKQRMHDEASLGKRQQFINGLIGLGSIATMIVGVATRGRCGRGMGGYGGYGGGYGGYRGGYGGYGGGYGGYGGGYGGYGGGYYY